MVYPPARTTSSLRTLGVQATTANIPPNAEAIVSYRLPGSGKSSSSEWKPSEPLPNDQIWEISLRVGDRAVQFEVQYQAPKGSPACDQAPDTSFSPALPTSQTHGFLPNWP